MKGNDAVKPLRGRSQCLMTQGSYGSLEFESNAGKLEDASNDKTSIANSFRARSPNWRLPLMKILAAHLLAQTATLSNSSTQTARE